MGTDIHLYVEKRNPDGTWSCVDPPARDLALYPRERTRADGTTYDSAFYGPHDCMYESKCYGAYDKTGDEWVEIPCGPTCQRCLGTGRDFDWYHNRNYDVFAILANVRNGHGFAGVDTGDGFKVIAAPRGVPADVSPRVRDHNTWDHTPSWLLVSELLAFDWQQTTKHRGTIPLRISDEDHPFGEPESYELWRARRDASPKSWCGHIGGPGIVTISPELADAFLAEPGRIPADRKVYVRVEWDEKYAASACDFLAFMEHYLLPLGNPAEHRIVFGFDS